MLQRRRSKVMCVVKVTCFRCLTVRMKVSEQLCVEQFSCVCRLYIFCVSLCAQTVTTTANWLNCVVLNVAETVTPQIVNAQGVEFDAQQYDIQGKCLAIDVNSIAVNCVCVLHVDLQCLCCATRMANIVFCWCCWMQNIVRVLLNFCGRCRSRRSASNKHWRRHWIKWALSRRRCE